MAVRWDIPRAERQPGLSLQRRAEVLRRARRRQIFCLQSKALGRLRGDQASISFRSGTVRGRVRMALSRRIDAPKKWKERKRLNFISTPLHYTGCITV